MISIRTNLPASQTKVVMKKKLLMRLLDMWLWFLQLFFLLCFNSFARKLTDGSIVPSLEALRLSTVKKKTHTALRTLPSIPTLPPLMTRDLVSEVYP